MRISRKTFRPPQQYPALGLLALVGSLAMGCAPEFERLDFTMRTFAPAGVTVSVAYEGITIPAGIAVGVVVTPIDDSGDTMDEDVEVLLLSNNPGVIGIDRALENRSFVIYGAGAGSASILVDADGESQGKIPATVVLQ
jgi:hypothetical protein